MMFLLSRRARSASPRSASPARKKKGVVRERNRMHARKARLRKKIYLDSLKQSVEQLEEENARLQGILRRYQEDEAGRNGTSSGSSTGSSDEDVVISDPHQPDNPIVFASDTFYELTGYKPSEILGRNCRLLQGPLTDRREIAKIRAAVRADPPREVCTVLINYTK